MSYEDFRPVYGGSLIQLQKLFLCPEACSYDRSYRGFAVDVRLGRGRLHSLPFSTNVLSAMQKYWAWSISRPLKIGYSGQEYDTVLLEGELSDQLPVLPPRCCRYCEISIRRSKEYSPEKVFIM